MQHTCHGQVYYDGEIDVYEEGELVRTEYDVKHARHGTILFIENGAGRLEFVSTHARHGEIIFIENGVLARTEFVSPNMRKGEIDFYEEGKHVRTEYVTSHTRHGEIGFMDEEGEHLRTEYVWPHRICKAPRSVRRYFRAVGRFSLLLRKTTRRTANTSRESATGASAGVPSHTSRRRSGRRASACLQGVPGGGCAKADEPQRRTQV